jgi:ligand-binding SRPBCC domain-containing protein
VPTVERTSDLAADAAEVWARAVTPGGINDELRPILRMTMPASLRDRTIDDVTVGEPLGRSWILLGGVIPVDFDDLCLVELEPGRRFRERSRTLAFSLWQHERTVEAIGAGACRISDRLSFELRRGLAWAPGAARLARAIVAGLFSHRHRRLKRRYG